MQFMSCHVMLVPFFFFFFFLLLFFPLSPLSLFLFSVGVVLYTVCSISHVFFFFLFFCTRRRANGRDWSDTAYAVTFSFLMIIFNKRLINTSLKDFYYSYVYIEYTRMFYIHTVCI